MVSNESRPRGTSIAESYGRPVTLYDVEDILTAGGCPRGTVVKALRAMQDWASWEKTKIIRPWGDLASGGLTRTDAERTAERRRQIADEQIEQNRVRREREREAQVIELPVIPGQTIADVVAEHTRTEPEPEPVREDTPVFTTDLPRGRMTDLYPELPLPGPEPVAAAPEPTPSPVTPEPVPAPPEVAPEPAQAIRMLTCRTCGLELPEDSFHQDKSRPTGRLSHCRDCRAAIRAEHRENAARRRAEAEDRRASESAARALAATRPAAMPPAAPATPLRPAAGSADGSDAVPAGSKRCHGCLKEKPLAAFRRNPSVKDGHRGRCKDCESQSAQVKRMIGYVTPPPPPPPAPEPQAGTKLCRRCGELRDVPDDFYRRAGRKISNTCIMCEREIARDRKKNIVLSRVRQ